jgi:phosphocarrier protein HPr
MIQQEFEIRNKLGLHARPAAVLSQKMSRFSSSIKLSKEGEEVDAKSVMGILTLGAACGERVKITIDGPDEAQVLEVVRDLVEHCFYTEPQE